MPSRKPTGKSTKSTDQPPLSSQDEHRKMLMRKVDEIFEGLTLSELAKIGSYILIPLGFPDFIPRLWDDMNEVGRAIYEEAHLRVDDPDMETILLKSVDASKFMEDRQFMLVILTRWLSVMAMIRVVNRKVTDGADSDSETSAGKSSLAIAS